MRGIRWRRCTRCWPGCRRGWLVVFDNVPDRASVAPFVPPAGPGRVLITTQNQHWPPGQALEVPVLDPEVAADFLVNRTGDADRAAARELAGRAGRAAAGAGAGRRVHAGHRDRRWPGTCRCSGTGRRTCWPAGRSAGHPADVAATLGLALSRLAGEAPAAAGLVRLLAFLAPEPVPLALLLAGTRAAGRLEPGGGGRGGAVCWGMRWRRGMRSPRCAGYSLVTPAGDGLVLVHRLVQAITRAQLPAEEADRWGQAAAALVEAAVPADPRAACGVAGVRGAAAARPGCPGPDQRRHAGRSRSTWGGAAATRRRGTCGS